VLEAASDPVDDCDVWEDGITRQFGQRSSGLIDTSLRRHHCETLEIPVMATPTDIGRAASAAKPICSKPRQSRLGFGLLMLCLALAGLWRFGTFATRAPRPEQARTAATSSSAERKAQTPHTKRIEDVVVADHVRKQPPGIKATDAGSAGNDVPALRDALHTIDTAQDGWHTAPADDVLPSGLSFKIADGRITEVAGEADDHRLIGTRYVPGDLDATDVTRVLWRRVELELTKADGSVAKLSVGRPLWWLERTDSAVDRSIDLAMHEVGIEGTATITGIFPCDADSRELDAESALVTGKIEHHNAVVWDLSFDGDTTAPLGVTANHPIFSDDRMNWVPAGELQVNERVETAEGVATLTDKTQRSGRHDVYNIEVHRSHAYYVSQFGVLAHNTGFRCLGGRYSSDDIAEALREATCASWTRRLPARPGRIGTTSSLLPFLGTKRQRARGSASVASTSTVSALNSPRANTRQFIAAHGVTVCEDRCSKRNRKTAAESLRQRKSGALAVANCDFSNTEPGAFCRTGTSVNA
jgi:hypothetical protein